MSGITILKNDGTIIEDSSIYQDFEFYCWSSDNIRWHIEPDLSYDIDGLLVRLYDHFQWYLYDRNGLDYYEGIHSRPIWRLDAGISSELPVSKEHFENLSKDGSEELYRELYLHDCHQQISFLQNRIVELKEMLTLFYKEFCNLEIEPRIMNEFSDTVFFTNSYALQSIVSTIFITAYSILDQFTKLAFLSENLQTDFSSYPKLGNKNILFGHKKRLSLPVEGTVFEDSSTTDYISTLRNALVHDASLQMHNKIYVKTVEGKVVEKWILLPDMEPKFFHSHINRNRFFSKEVKLNDFIPELMKQFFGRVHKTCVVLNENFSNT